MVEVEKGAYFTFYYFHVVCAWQEWCPLTINFVIINMRQTWSRKRLENHPFTPTFHQHLSSSWFFDGVRVAQRFSFLLCVSCFPCPSTVSCAQCCLCHWIFHFWLHLRFSLAFSYKYTFHVIPKHYLTYIVMNWLYICTNNVKRYSQIVQVCKIV